jgi:hypothetical protein
VIRHYLVRAAVLLALALIAASGFAQAPETYDPWNRLQEVWNPFAQKLNKGELDVKQWHKVVSAVEAIDGRKCK